MKQKQFRVLILKDNSPKVTCLVGLDAVSTLVCSTLQTKEVQTVVVRVRSTPRTLRVQYSTVHQPVFVLICAMPPAYRLVRSV